MIHRNKNYPIVGYQSTLVLRNKTPNKLHAKISVNITKQDFQWNNKNVNNENKLNITIKFSICISMYSDGKYICFQVHWYNSKNNPKTCCLAASGIKKK